jgi:hypothetical protein
VKLFGVPLQVWDESFFNKLGGRLDDFIDYDVDTAEGNRFGVARILISTYRWGFIDEWVKVEVMGAVFNITVVEDGLREVEDLRREDGDNIHSRSEEDGGRREIFPFDESSNGGDDQDVDKSREDKSL